MPTFATDTNKKSMDILTNTISLLFRPPSKGDRKIWAGDRPAATQAATVVIYGSPQHGMGVENMIIKVSKDMKISASVSRCRYMTT